MAWSVAALMTLAAIWYRRAAMDVAHARMDEIRDLLRENAKLERKITKTHEENLEIIAWHYWGNGAKTKTPRGPAKN